MNWVVFLITWFLSGILSLLISCGMDMRNEEYDENYFKGTEFICVWIVVSGYIGLISVLLTLIYDSFKNRPKHTLTKLIYKIVNIGVKEKDENR